MDKLFLVLAMDTNAPRGAGWYLSASDAERYLIPHTSISSAAATELAGAFQRALQSTDEELPQLTFPQMTQSADGLIRQHLEQQLREAEEHAARIPQLRQKLALAPPPRKQNDRGLDPNKG